MEPIINSIERLLQSLSLSHWAFLFILLLAFAIFGRLGYFFAFASLGLFVWVLSDLAQKSHMDVVYTWAFTGVLIATFFCAIYSIFDRIIRSGQ